ncbi:hypothetical protein AX17_000947 [Amanita inopinata Kibby_2008]|nr:hypothetical protein AX17_000947 [Amanita inopinata Kibby_2008]
MPIWRTQNTLLIPSHPQILSVDHAQTLVPEGKTRVAALNWLLSVGLFKPLHDEKGKLVAFRAVTRGEIAATKDLTSDEKLVLDHITGTRNDGIWTKTLKAKTNLHQNVVDRCLKSLVQKKLIKRVPAVNNKKIYMLEGLEPSVELTGGAWYIDGELDTGLIHHLSEACLKIIREMSSPKRQHEKDGAIYPVSNAPKYPNAKDILKFIKKANITQVDLTVQDIETLLNVLILDGEIERLPAVGSAFWDVRNIADGDDDDDDINERHSNKKRKRQSDKEGARSSKRKRKQKQKPSTNGADSSSNSDDDTKRSKRKRPKAIPDSESSDPGKHRHKKKSRALFADDSSSNNENEEEPKYSRKKKKKSRRKDDSSSDSDSSSSDSDSDHDTGRKVNKALKRSSSQVQTFQLDDLDDGTNNVYRAIKQEHMSFGWIEAPCCLCPSFDFCKDGGPVNPRECVYYGDWLAGGSVDAIEDGVL